ncbi:MAG: heme ABC transporter ATP-binding protein [Chthonomonadales bacterium]|nr:heme ABC transporter ATP-binding protein [Chthonomonadales bacterium]
MRIVAHGLVAGYGAEPVLGGVSLRLEPGELVGLVGPNGAGKSTLLRALTGALRPSSGTVRIGEHPIETLGSRDVARLVAVVPQTEPRLFDFTVREMVLMGRNPHRRRGGDTEEDYAAVARALAAADILHIADRPVTALSGGEHRRVLIARALAQATPIVLLDEPTAHLDLVHQVDLLSVLRRLVDTEGTAVLAALHDLNLAADYCDRLLLIAHGRIAADGRPEEVLTPALLEASYGAPVQVLRSPVSGRPLVLAGAAEVGAAPETAPRVHLVCGGGTGLEALSLLRRRGLVVTAGVLNRLDSDQEAAEVLGVEHVAEAPFSPIGEQARAACAALIARADAVVIAEVAFGRGNLANLELAAEAARSGKRVFIVRPGAIGERDFTGGEASALVGRLRALGAIAVEHVDEAVTALRRAITQAQPAVQTREESREGTRGR